MFKIKGKIIITMFLLLILLSSLVLATEVQITDVEQNQIQEEILTTQQPEVNENIIVPTEGINEINTTTTGDTETKTPKEYATDQYLFNKEKIEFIDTVDGNVFIASPEVVISGKIAGDLFVVGQDVKIDGALIYGNVFVCSENFMLNGTVYDLYLFAKEAEIKYNGLIYRDLRAYTTNLKMSGIVSRNAFIVGEEKIEFTKDAIISGKLEYTLPETGSFVKDEASQIGEIEVKKSTMNEVQGIIKEKNIRTEIVSKIMTVLTLLVTASAVYLVLLSKNKETMSNMKNLMKNKLGIIIISGLIFVLVVPILIIILLLLKVTLSLAFILLLLYIVFLILSETFVALGISSLLVSDEDTEIMKYIKFLLITLIYSVIILILWQLIPIVSFILFILIGMFGSGIILANVFNKKTIQ